MRLIPGVGGRLGVMMVLALLPLGLLSMSQTRSITDQAEQVALDAVLGETLQAASDEIDLIRGARATARTLAAILLPYLEDVEDCRLLMDSATAAQPLASLISFIPVSGLMTCANGGRTFDFRESQIWQSNIAAQAPRISTNPNGPVSNTAVLGVTHPVFDPFGDYLGYVAVSLPHAAIEADRDRPGARQPVALITFNSDGMLLASSAGLEDAQRFLPRNRPLNLLAREGPHSFIGNSNLGARRMFAVVPIEGDLYLMGTWPIEGHDALIDAGAEPYLFPVLMWIVGLAVALLASERLVARPLRTLARSMRAFTRGDRSQKPVNIDNPPAEIEALLDTYRTMTQTILRDEADLENLLRQKADLLREVHHRTGNSLQLIASILRMHLREEPEEEVRLLLENLHDRVMSLSTVHFGLYRMAGKSDIAVDALLADVITKIAAIHVRFGRKDTILTELQPLALTADQAVPLALLTAEILSCFSVSEMGSEAAPIRVSLVDAPENRARLAISGPMAARGALTGEGSGVPEIIAGRLIRAFVSQLDGQMEVKALGEAVTATVTFTRRLAGKEADAAEQGEEPR